LAFVAQNIHPFIDPIELSPWSYGIVFKPYHPGANPKYRNLNASVIKTCKKKKPRAILTQKHFVLF
jgi:hypothetical protein